MSLTKKQVYCILIVLKEALLKTEGKTENIPLRVDTVSKVITCHTDAKRFAEYRGVCNVGKDLYGR